MHIYCLYCQTEKCPVTVKVLERCGYDRVIYPQAITRERVQGKNVDVCRSLLPGYLFVYQEEPLSNVTKLKLDANAKRLLGDARTDYELQDTDYDFAMNLLQKGGVLNTIRVIRVGDRAMIDDPVFAACEGEITKVDNRKQRARVDFKLSGMDCHVWVGFEMVKAEEKREADQENKEEG